MLLLMPYIRETKVTLVKYIGLFVLILRSLNTAWMYYCIWIVFSTAQTEVSELVSLQDDENTKLSAKIKELEEDRARLQKTVSIQQTQIEKHRALAAESNKKCDGLQLEVSGLSKVCVANSSEQITTATISLKQAVKLDSVIHLSCCCVSPVFVLCVGDRKSE